MSGQADNHLIVEISLLDTTVIIATMKRAALDRKRASK